VDWVVILLVFFGAIGLLSLLAVFSKLWNKKSLSLPNAQPCSPQPLQYPKMIICNKCGKTNPSNNEFCCLCGFLLQEEFTLCYDGYGKSPPPKNISDSGESPPSSLGQDDKTCQNCGHVLRLNSKFCGACGARQESKIPETTLLKELGQEISVVVTDEVPRNKIDNVHFSVTSPSKVCPGTSFVIDIWAHLGEQREEVIRRTQEAFPGIEICVKSKGPVNLSRGTVLTIRLKIDQLEVENYEDTLMWNNEVGNANFRVVVPEETAMGSKAGVATIHANGIQITRIYFNIYVGNETFRNEKIQTKQEEIRTAFASYASEDLEKVLSRIQGLQKIAPQMKIYLDKAFLQSGQYWEEELLKKILSSDIFYLFWSQNAAKSEWVKKEWQCAFNERGLDFIDPVPLVDPAEVPPPPELARKHFNDWVLAYMRKQQ
jgi:hypothetical protein